MVIYISSTSVYSPDDEDIATKDDNNANAFDYTVLKDPVLHSSQRLEVRRLIQQVEERTKLAEAVYIPRNRLDIDDIIHRPLNEKTRGLITKRLRDEAAEKNSIKDNKYSLNEELEEDMVYAVCVKRSQEENVSEGSKSTIETQENMKDVKVLIKEVEERLRMETTLEKAPLVRVSRTAANTLVQSFQTPYLNQRPTDNDTCHSSPSSGNLSDVSISCRSVQTQSSGDLSDILVNCRSVHTQSSGDLSDLLVSCRSVQTESSSSVVNASVSCNLIDDQIVHGVQDSDEGIKVFLNQESNVIPSLL